MTILFIFFLFIIIGCLIIFGHRKNSTVLLSIFFVFFFIAFGNGFIPFFLLKNLESPYITSDQPHWKESNAIILLGSGTITIPGTGVIKPAVLAYSRINETLRLYLACKTIKKRCTIIISGGNAAFSKKSEALVYSENLTNLGVNNQDILLEPNSNNTYKNAEFTSLILKDKKFDQVILVTSGIHLKRALLYFSHFGINAIPAPSDYIMPSISIFPLAYNFTLADFALHEYAGIMRLYIYDYFGWNASTANRTAAI